MSTSIVTPAPATVRQPAPAVSPWTDPACGASFFLTLLHLIFAVFSVAFRRDTAAPEPEAALAPEFVPDLTTLHSFKTTLFDSRLYPALSVQSTASMGVIASTCPDCASRLGDLARFTGRMPWPALRAFTSPAQSASIRNPQSAFRNTPVSCLLTPVSYPPHSSHPPPPP